MFTLNDARYGKPLKIIHAGEYYASGKDELIGTLLGPCVALCLFDPEMGIAGMNHFMLPGRSRGISECGDSFRYGVSAIHSLMESMKSMGVEKQNLRAKIFGGGNVLDLRQRSNTIPEDNVRLAKIIMEVEDIPIDEVDVRGTYTRKLMMDVKSGKVFLKKTVSCEIHGLPKGDNGQAENFM
jgi:chemotaxis protein CheD